MERLIAWYRLTSSVGAVVALLVANVIPLVGVLFLGWNVWTILIVYWLENGIVGVFNVAKMARAEGGDADGSPNVIVNGRSVSSTAKLGLIPFFVMHYGIFWTVHGVFVLTLPLFGSMGADTGPDMTNGFSPGTIGIAVIALTISHAVSYYFNFLRGGEYRRVSAAGQMFAPYGRLVVLHITIILGGIAIASMGAPAAAIVILVGLKTLLDLGFHLAEHRKVAAVPPGTATAT
ncbi:MAG: DUF6498-containing protein [Candidatus Limnocylindrales bacterium]